MTEETEETEEKKKQEQQEQQEQKRDKLIRELQQVICICKGIKLGTVIKSLKDAVTVEDVNRRAGTGQGNCKGERCGPKIGVLLEKKRRHK